MLDNAATGNCITTACINKLNLIKRKANVQIDGLGKQPVAIAKSIANISFCAYFDKSIKYSIPALVVKTITSQQPVSKVDTSKLSHLFKLQLADKDFHLPGKIDILVGAELYYEIMDGVKSDFPVATKSKLGWLIGGGKGNHAIAEETALVTSAVDSKDQFCQLDALLKKFWELEAVPKASMFSLEEQQCESHFKHTFTRDSNGRFVVRYPFKGDPAKALGDSLQIAVRRFKQVERRLQNSSSNTQEYIKFMQEYESLGHMVEVEPPTPQSKFRCYIPHHFVVKESSTTTKFRVVFDASAKTSSGKSLNDVMMVGPVIQDSLTNLIIRFRKHKIAVTADIEKMYRQVLIHPEDQEFQHIVWREAPDKPLRHFRLLTVTYGTAAGPYLATKALHTLAEIEQDNFPIAAKIIKEDFYVDDCMTGADTVDNVISMQQQLIELLNRGAMSIRKFTSNSTAVLQSLPEDLRETKFTSLDKDNGVKALGIFWSPTGDYFGFQTDYKASSVNPTKRLILSEIAKLFDPIGWLAPVVIRAKILMQSIWKEKLEWDDEVPDSIKKQWELFKSDLINLQKLKIPREQYFDSQHSCLVGFSDASEQAYSACIYLCTYGPGNISTSLVTSKTRVAPLQKESLPRLELCGAHLLAELMPTVVEALQMNKPAVTSFTDSTLVLNWVYSEPYRYKTYVANRIAKIQALIPSKSWGFVQGVENPADCASRGISSHELVQHPLWWKGPEWLKTGPPVVQVPIFKKIPETQVPDLETRKIVSCHITVPRMSREIFSTYSTLTKLQRVVAYMFRFVNNMRAAISMKKNKSVEIKQVGWLTIQELHFALMKLISVAQEQEFTEDIHSLKNNQRLSRRSKILSLTPFVDNRDILRVGGRLRQAKIPTHQKHPILLPQNHRLTRLIINEAHRNNLHAGPQTLLSYLQQKYWIVRGKDAVRKEIRNCVICIKQRAETMKQLMGDLPAFRVNPSYPFQHTGVDYAGPLLIKSIVPRSKTTLKAYIAIFICCATRAIHLEVVSSATTEAFIAALRRFIAKFKFTT